MPRKLNPMGPAPVGTGTANVANAQGWQNKLGVGDGWAPGAGQPPWAKALGQSTAVMPAGRPNIPGLAKMGPLPPLGTEDVQGMPADLFTALMNRLGARGPG